MRIALVLAAGALASLAAYAVSATAGGLVGAAAFLMVFAIPPVAMGIAVGIAMSAWEERRMAPRFRVRERNPKDRCACGRIRLESSGVMICPRCDRVESSYHMAG